MAEFMQLSLLAINRVFCNFNGRRACRQRLKESVDQTSNLDYAPSYPTDMNREKAMRKTRSILKPADVDDFVALLGAQCAARSPISRPRARFVLALGCHLAQRRMDCTSYRGWTPVWMELGGSRAVDDQQTRRVYLRIFGGVVAAA